MAREESQVLSPGDFGRALHRFLQASLARAPPQDPEVARRLREHLGVERLVELPILTRTFGAFDHPNLQVALDGLLAGGAWSAQTLGLRSQQALYGGESLGQIVLLAGGDGLESGLGLTTAALEHVTVSLGPDESIACMANALLLLRAGQRAVAALISRNDERMGGAAVRLDVLAAERADGERLLGEIEALMRRHNVYRGRVVAFGGNRYEGTVLTVRALPAVERGAIVLPDGALERIERHALGPMRHRERLLAAGRHLKRGLLLYGPPGTGKTLTAMYLIARMPGRTTVLLTGQGLGLIAEGCALARALQPATVVLEDVDLVAREREYDEEAGGPVLFELLNQMDGLAEDADVLFLLTTNRPDVLEPALAARPGQIDQSVELPLPDAADRRRLIGLYARGLELHAERLDELVERLQGASPAHVKELLRKAALLAADERQGEIVVEDRHLDAAVDELVIVGSDVRASVSGPAPGPADFPFPAHDDADEHDLTS